VVAIEFLVVPHEEAATEPYAGLIDLIAKYAKQIEHWEASFQIPELVDINVLVNEMVWYSTYPGSFTTPPCSEIVTFLLMNKVLLVSEDIVNSLTGIMGEYDMVLHTNSRPTQPVNNRTILTNLKPTQQIKPPVSAAFRTSILGSFWILILAVCLL